MIVIERRVDVQLISSDALRTYMQFRALTVRKLAKAAGCSPATVGHLRSGARKTCQPQTARAIAEALGAPVEALFVARLSNISREVAA